MTDSMSPNEGKNMVDLIKKFAVNSQGIEWIEKDFEFFELKQRVDEKALLIRVSEIDDVLERSDENGYSFLQLNFKTGVKILVTDKLIGFKPVPLQGLDMAGLPKVVTTPDIMSVFEAIEESIGFDERSLRDIDTLKKVYLSIVRGGEAIGFDLQEERQWLERLLTTQLSATA